MTPAELYAIYCQCDRSTRKTAHALRDRGIAISHETVRQRLVAAGYKLRSIGGIEAENPLDAVVATRVEPELANWLRSLPGEKDAHLREALRRYRARGAATPSGGKIGAGKLVSGRVEKELKDWLRSIGSRKEAAHLREALRQYKESVNRGDLS